MRTTTGGYRCAEFETLLAPDIPAGCIGKKLYAITTLPGVWRRVKEPKGDPIASGLVPCWFDGGVIYLERCEGIEEELEHTRPDVIDPDGVGAFLTTLAESRTAARIKAAEAGGIAGPPAQNLHGGAGEAAGATAAEGDKPADTVTGVPPPDDVDV